MPYILPQLRASAEPMPDMSADTPGLLNFQFARLIDAYVRDNGLSYATLNEITGALNDVATEFERRIVGPYEDVKRRGNGEVFTSSVELLTQLLNDELQVRHRTP